MIEKTSSAVPGEIKHDEMLEFISFYLDDIEYGVKILDVQEIRGWEVPTPLPESPAYILGVINIRGSIVPVIDLRKKFHLNPKEYNKFTVVIVLQIEHENKIKSIGIVVDSVSEVYSFNTNEIKAVPDTCSINKKYLLGMYPKKNGILILLNVQCILTSSELEHDFTAR